MLMRTTQSPNRIGEGICKSCYHGLTLDGQKPLQIEAHSQECARLCSCLARDSQRSILVLLARQSDVNFR